MFALEIYSSWRGQNSAHAVKESDLMKRIQLFINGKRILCGLCGKNRDGGHVSYCRPCYNDFKRKHYLRNRDREIARCSKWNKENSSRVARNMQRCRDRRPEFYRQYAISYAKKNPDRVALHDKNKRFKRRSKIVFPISFSEWKFIKDRFGNVCFYCNESKTLTMDHFMPLSKGGLHVPENIVPACRNCNSKKGAKIPYDYLAQIGKTL